MTPLNVLLKLVRSRSQMAFVAKSFATSKSLWREKGEFSNQFKNCKPSGDFKPDERNPEKQGRGCGPKDDAQKHSTKHYAKKQQGRPECCPSEFDEYLEKKKQGSSCGPIETTDKCLNETQKKPNKPRCLGTEVSSQEDVCGQHKTSKGCSCPPYDTPKCSKEIDVKKEEKTMAGCSELPQEKNEYTPKQRKQDPCEMKKPKCLQKEKQQDTEEGDEECARDNHPKKINYCGPDKNSYKDPYPDDKNSCSKYGKSRKIQDRDCEERFDSCGPNKKSSKSFDPCESNKCSSKSLDTCESIKNLSKSLDPCEPDNNSSKSFCPEKDECISVKKQSNCDPCEISQKNICPEVKKDKCLDEQKQDICPEDMPKKEIKVPELPPCCKVDAAKECICKLRELERRWEEVVAAQEELGGKDGCHKSQELGKVNQSRPNVKKPYLLDPCNISQKSVCPESNEEKCIDEQQQTCCPGDNPKKEIKIPELSPCCKVDAANECICKLKELQKEWEEVIAAQKNAEKDECLKSQGSGKVGHQGSSMKKASRSNLIYIVLVAILAAVMYYTYNEDFETEELFLKNEEIKNEDNDDED